MPDLSILIPARNEMFLRRTVEDLLAAIRGDTEIIVVLDGAWAEPPLEMNERVTVLYNHEPVGQRAATNQAARVAAGKWVMKCDAHCSFSEGFDVKMLEAASGHEDWTLVPKMFNLHAFDRVCQACGHREYQGPTIPVCPECGVEQELVKEMVWKPRPSPETTAMRFTPELRFDYWGGYKPRQRWENDCAETMSLLGACWMLTRERYFDLDICDEQFGSWGQQGTEVACKTWLSGGRLVCVRSCWFAHMFRTQGGDFGFPYEQSGRQIQHARDRSKELFIGDKWEKAVRPFRWIIDHFAPVPGFEVDKAIVYYTDNRLPRRLARECRRTLIPSGLPIVSVSLKPMPGFGENVHYHAKPGPVTMLNQILLGLLTAAADYVFLCEHDVLYHPSHFEFVPPRDDRFYYNVNVWQAVLDSGLANKVDDRRQVSGLCASRQLLVAEYERRIEQARVVTPHRIGYEPGTRDGRSETWSSEYPNVDVRHGGNLTRTKRHPNDFRNSRYAQGWQELPIGEIPGWDGLDRVAQNTETIKS